MTTQKTEEVIHKHVDEQKDSFEIGTPSKGGVIKVYHNFDDVEGFKRKIENAKTVRNYAREILSEIP